ncbi:MAG TPA: hypothetical protein VNF99_03360 [Stellaceae bacterium]|nr:hypothetical protein [Stellaceae bacterium]
MPLLANPPPLPARPAPAPQGVAGLCALATELASLLERETGLIRAMRLKEIAPLQADKARLTKSCGSALKTIDPAAPVAAALKDQWRAVSKKLGDAAIANEMALRVGHAATDQLVSAIIGHIERRRSATASYARPQPISAGPTRRPPLAGVALDRRL